MDQKGDAEVDSKSSGDAIMIINNPQGAACDYQPKEGTLDMLTEVGVPQGAACDSQPGMFVRDLNDSQSAARDSQPGRLARDLNDSQSAACDSQPGMKFGANLNEKMLNMTPIGLDTPKRKLLWSPETPRGRSRKYSIGEAASPDLRRRIDGVLLINGRYAIPVDDHDIGQATMGMASLNIDRQDVTDNINVIGEGKMCTGNSVYIEKKNSPPTLKTKKRGRMGRAKRSSKRMTDPKQKLIPDMIKKKAKDGIEDNNHEPEAHD